MRKAKPKKRYILPDPIYQDTLVTKFVNNLMIDGKKSLSYTIFYNAINQVEKKTGENVRLVFDSGQNLPVFFISR